jgi:hypothetical protein
MGKRKGKPKPFRPVWRKIGETKKGRPKSEGNLTKWSPAKSGVSAWFIRNRVSSRVGRLRPDLYSYEFTMDYRYRLAHRGATVISGSIPLTVDPRAIRSRKTFRKLGGKKREHFIGTSIFRRNLNRAAWLIYRETVQDLLIKPSHYLPSYSKSITGRGVGRKYASLELRLRVIRTKRKLDAPKKRKKGRKGK